MICVVCGCDDQNGTKRIVFFTLPVTPVVREKWLKALKLTCMPEGGAVCSKHFKPNELRRINGKVTVATYAVPEPRKNKKVTKPTHKTSEDATKTIDDNPGKHVEGSVIMLEVEPMGIPMDSDNSKHKMNSTLAVTPAQNLPEQATDRLLSLDDTTRQQVDGTISLPHSTPVPPRIRSPSATENVKCLSPPSPVTNRANASVVAEIVSPTAPPIPNQQPNAPISARFPALPAIAPPIPKQQPIGTASARFPTLSSIDPPIPNHQPVETVSACFPTLSVIAPPILRQQPIEIVPAPFLTLSSTAPPIREQQSMGTVSARIPTLSLAPSSAYEQLTANCNTITEPILASQPIQTLPKSFNVCLVPSDEPMILKPSPIKLKSTGMQTMPLKTDDWTQQPKRRYFVLPKYISKQPILHIQAVKIGESGVTPMPITSTICRSTQTSINYLNSLATDKAVNPSYCETDLLYCDPFEFLDCKDKNASLQMDLDKANKKIEKLKGLIEKKNKQIRTTTRNLQRKYTSIEILKEKLLEFKKKPTRRRRNVQSELEKEFNQNVGLITAMKIAEYEEGPSDNLTVPVASLTDDSNHMPDVNDEVPAVSMNGTKILDSDMVEIVTSMDSSDCSSENMQKFEIVEEVPAVFYSTYISSENVR